MNKPLIPAQRRERIQEYLEIHNIVRIGDLSAMLGASEATIRRDLEWMESEGLVERTHGGAILTERTLLEPEYLQRAQRYPEEKRKIGACAASMINDGDIIFINGGTTSTQVMRHIRGHAGITVITNNLTAALEVGAAGFKLILLGGDFQSTSNATAGRFAIENLNKVYASKAFISVDGFSLKYGFTVPTNAEAEIIGCMVERTHGVVSLMADHSKWGVVSNFQVAAIDQVHRFITDDQISQHALDALAARSIEVVIAGESNARSG